MDAVVLLPGEGEHIAAGASTAVMKATAETTGGAFSMSEATFPAGMNGPPPHAHRYTTDTFYVLEGTLHMTLGDSEIDASTGSYILVPPGLVHTFGNISDEPGAVPQPQRSWRFGEVPARSCRCDALRHDARDPRLRGDRREVRFRGPDIGLHRISTFDCGDRRGSRRMFPNISYDAD
jgi:quercetin dioxygenase-like cupin family protein